MAGSGLLLVWVGVSLGFAAVAGVSAVTSALNAATAGVAAAAGLLCALWGRVSGRLPTMWVAAAFGVLAATIGLAEAAAALATVTGWLPDAGRVAGTLVVVGLVAAAAVSQDVDTALTGRQVTLLAISAVVVFTPLVGFVDAGASGLIAPAWADLAESVILTASLLAIAVTCIARAAHADRFLFAWLGLMFFGLSLAEGTSTIAQTTGRVTVGGEALALASVVCGMTGVALELRIAFAAQRERLLESLIQGRAAVARVHAQHAAARQQAHDAYSALAAIEGASRTLQRAHDRLDAETRKALSDGIASEITRLQHLIAAPAPPDSGLPFDLAAALRPVIAHERAEGTDVVADVREGLTAFGRAPDTAEVVTRLLRRARDHAPGRPVLIRTDWAAGRALVRLEDRGGQGAPGDLELEVCARLMGEQDGEMRVEDRGDGGAVYTLVLPAVGGPGDLQPYGVLGARAKPVHERDESGKIAEVHGLLAVRGDEATPPPGAPAVGKSDDQVRHDPGGNDPGDQREVESRDPASAAVDDHDVQVGASDDAGDRIAEQPRFDRDRDPPSR